MTEPAPLAAVVFLLLAAPFVGSFLGVIVLRLPEGRGVVAGRSACPACGRALGAADLVPLASWALLRGRCRSCGAALGAFYPAIELAALAVALWSVAVLPGWLAHAGALLGWTLLALAEIDRRTTLLPDALTLPLIAGGLAVAAALPGEALADHLVGAAAGVLSLGAVAAGYAALRGREGLGLGDVKLFAAAGAWVGWQGLASVLLIAAATGLAVALLGALRRGRLAGTDALPFGPFLAFGLWITFLYGPLRLAG